MILAIGSTQYKHRAMKIDGFSNNQVRDKFINNLKEKVLLDNSIVFCIAGEAILVASNWLDWNDVFYLNEIEYIKNNPLLIHNLNCNQTDALTQYDYDLLIKHGAHFEEV